MEVGEVGGVLVGMVNLVALVFVVTATWVIVPAAQEEDLPKERVGLGWEY